MEDAQNGEIGNPHRSYLPSPILGYESRWYYHCDWSGRRDTAFLEHLPEEGEGAEGEVLPQYLVNLSALILIHMHFPIQKYHTSKYA